MSIGMSIDELYDFLLNAFKRTTMLTLLQVACVATYALIGTNQYVHMVLLVGLIMCLVMDQLSYTRLTRINKIRLEMKELNK